MQEEVLVLVACMRMWQNMQAHQTIINKGILSTYYKYTLSTVSNKLNISRHMAIRTYFFFCVCVGTYGQNSVRIFSHTLFTLSVEVS
jgi:hypothetical protein